MPRKGDSHGRQPPWRHGAHPHPLRHRHFPLGRPSPGPAALTGGARPNRRPTRSPTVGRRPRRARQRKRRGGGRLRDVSLPLCPSVPLPAPPRGSAHREAVPAHSERGRREWGTAGFKRLRSGNHLGNSRRNDGRPVLAGEQKSVEGWGCRVAWPQLCARVWKHHQLERVVVRQYHGITARALRKSGDKPTQPYHVQQSCRCRVSLGCSHLEPSVYRNLSPLCQVRDSSGSCL